MFALPTLVRHASGATEFHDGWLVSLPMELRDKYRLARYAEIDRPGWGVSEFGYAYFATHMPLGDFIVMPGLFIKDETRPSKRFYGYSANVTRKQVETAASGFTTYLEQVLSVARQDMGMLVHDLRALSNAIYNSAAAADRALNDNDIHATRKRIETVIASQGILKMRTDALDFAGNTPLDARSYDIPIFRKVDKVQRCFKSQAVDQKKAVKLSGTSFRKVRGPDVLELVPYAIIDNGLKYAPQHTAVEVHVADTSDSTVLTVSSFGPKIKDHERELIFTRHVRAKAALESGVPGTGIGLNMVKRIVDDAFGGSVEVEQVETGVTFDALAYFETQFIVNLPSFI